MKKLLALILLLLCAAVAASADDAVFTVQNAERMTMQEFRFDFSVPGADRVHMHEGNDWSSWQWETAGSEGYFTPRLYNSGDYTFHLWGQFDGDWREVADPITVTATAPYGELVWFNADCVVHTDEGQTATIGHDVAPYHEYVTRFWTVDGLDGYDEGSSYDNDGRVTENNTGTHISDLQGGRVYEAWVWDLCQGYEGSRHAAFITVGDSNSGLAVPNDGHQVFLFADDATVNTFTDIHLTAMGHGAESVKLFVSHNDGYLNDEFESDGDRYFQQYSWRHPGTYTVAASACFDGVWTDPEGCKFTVTVSNPYGSLPAPTVSMAAQTDPGQDVFIDFSETANAAHYSFWMSDAADENDQYVWGDGCTADENTPYPLRMRIPGYVLQPGHSYHIYLDVNAPGYTEGHDDRTLTVNSASAPYLYIENTSPTTMEQVHVAVSAPGAERIRFSSGYGDWWDEDGWEGEWWTDSFSHDYWADPDVTVRAEAMYNGQWQLVDEQTVSMYSGYGEMPGPDEYHLAHCLTAGEDLTVGLSLPGEASFWDVTVTDVDSGEQVCGAWRIYESREVTFSADNFESGREYRVNFQLCGYGYNSWRASELLYVQDDTSAVLLLSKTDDVEVLESITAVVSAPGAERIRFSSGYGNWWDEDGWEGDLWSTEGVCWDYWADPDVTVRAEAMYNGQWQLVGEQHVHMIASHGDMPAPSYYLARCLSAGEDLIVGLSMPGYASYWNINVYRADTGDWVCGEGQIRESREVTFDASLFESGTEYRIEIYLCGWGYNACHVNDLLYVRDNTSAVLLLSKTDDIDVMEGISAVVCAPGAERIRFSTGYDNWWYEDGWEGDSWYGAFSHDYWADPDITVKAEAMYNGQWQPVGEQHIHMVASNGDMPAPEYSVSKRIGDELAISVTLPEYAAYCDVNVLDGDTYLYSDRLYESGTITYPGSEFEPNTPYTVNLSMCGRGYNAWHANEIAIRSEGSDAYLYVSKSEFTTVDPVQVVVYAPGASRIRFYNGYSDTPPSVNGDWWAGEFSHDYFADPDISSVWATARYSDGWRQVASQPIQMISLFGDMPAPSYYLSHCLSAGENLTVGLTMPDYASYWNVSVYRADTGDWVNGEEHICETSEVTFSADNFESGVEYRVEFFLFGYGYNAWYADELLYVQDENPIMLLSKTDGIDVMENITAVVSAPGAERIRFSSGYDSWWDEDGWEGDSWFCDSVSWNYWADPDITVKAEAMYNGQWQPLDEQHVHMAASNGEMPAPDYSISQRIDDELMVSVILPEYAAYCDVNVREGDTYLHRDRLDESGTLTYPASEFETGALYTVELHLCGWGYNAWHTGETVVRSGGYNEDIQLTVNDEDGYLQVPVNTNVNAVVTAPANATAILTWGGYNWQWRYTNNVEDNHKVLRFDDWYFGEGELSLMARYTTDDLDYGEDIDRYTWSGLSNVVALSAYATGAATEASVTLADNDLTRGDTFSFTVDNLDQFNGLSWNIHDEQYDGWVFDEWRWVSFEGEGSTTATFEEDTTFWYTDQEEAHFSLCTVANGFSGETNTTTWHDITLRAQAGAEPQFSAPASVAQGEDVVITILNPEDGMNWHAWIWENDNQHEYRYWDGVDTIRVPTNQIPANETVQLYVAHDGKAGYAGADKGVDLQVTGQITDPVIHTDKEYYATGETFEIIAYAPGASGVALSLYHEGETDPFAQNQEENGDTLWFYWSDGGVHEIRIEMTATYPDGSTKTASDTINTFAPYGQLDTPTVTASRMQQQGWFMEFDVDRHGGEWWWTVEVQDNSDNVIAHWDKNTSGDETHFGFDTANLLGSYHIFVYASQQGYSDTWVNFDFEVVENLVIATLPSALTEIEEEAFEGADFQWVVIPQSVTYIGSRAFANCSNLQAIIILGQPTIEEDAFAGGVASRTFFAAENSDIWSWLLNHGCWVEPLSYAGY